MPEGDWGIGINCTVTDRQRLRVRLKPLADFMRFGAEGKSVPDVDVILSLSVDR